MISCLNTLSIELVKCPRSHGRYENRARIVGRSPTVGVTYSIINIWSFSLGTRCSTFSGPKQHWAFAGSSLHYMIHLDLINNVFTLSFGYIILWTNNAIYNSVLIILCLVGILKYENSISNFTFTAFCG